VSNASTYGAYTFTSLVAEPVDPSCQIKSQFFFIQAAKAGHGSRMMF